MAIFKGFKQVTAEKFNAAKDANELVGYLWFVRTEVPETEGENDVNNDSYDIYFGSKKYGHFQAGEIEGIKSSIEELNGDVESILKTLETLTSAVETNAAAIAENKAAHEKNTTDIAGIQKSLTSFLVKDVDENDKVLNVADGILSSAIDLKYENNRISLVGKDNEEIAGFDASAFIKDSVLEDVEVTTKEDGEKYIVFTWKTEGEETKTDEIKVSDFAKLYNAGTALELAEDGVTFNVKVAENGNFLSVNDNNELIVDNITTDKTKLKEAITIEGGPLATDAVKAAFPDGVIPADSDIQAVLKALLCVEIYPTSSKNTPTFTASISNPSISATGASNNALVEVGQVINFGTVTAKQVTTTPTNPTVSGLTHGYSSTIDGEINSNTSISVEWDFNQKENNVYQLTASKTGFEGTLPTTVTATSHSECVLSACELTAVEGTNTYTVEEDAPIFVGTHDAIDAYYIVSNLGGRSEDKKSVTISANTGKEVNPSNKSGVFTVTGVYPCYTNRVPASTTDATAASMADLSNPVSGDGTKLALMTASTSFAVSFANQGIEPYKLFLPGSWVIKTAMAINPTTAKYAVDCKSKFVANGTTTRTIQGKEVTYTIYEWAATEGPNRVKFTVG